ncbi:MAG: hypothetical protein M1383_05680 [Patescibacteria group bacterium]|nr:hypothetical protein [Patescibacteria group bacterium]
MKYTWKTDLPVGTRLPWRGWWWEVLGQEDQKGKTLCRVIAEDSGAEDLEREIRSELVSKGWKPGFEFFISSGVLAAIARKHRPELVREEPATAKEPVAATTRPSGSLHNFFV